MSEKSMLLNQDEVRELAIKFFKGDEELSERFFAEIATDSITDELLKETGCWSDAVKNWILF